MAKKIWKLLKTFFWLSAGVMQFVCVCVVIRHGVSLDIRTMPALLSRAKAAARLLPKNQMRSAGLEVSFYLFASLFAQIHVSLAFAKRNPLSSQRWLVRQSDYTNSVITSSNWHIFDFESEANVNLFKFSFNNLITEYLPCLVWLRKRAPAVLENETQSRGIEMKEMRKSIRHSVLHTVMYHSRIA